MFEFSKDCRWFLVGQDVEVDAPSSGTHEVASAYDATAGRERHQKPSHPAVAELRRRSNEAKRAQYHRLLPKDSFHLELACGRGGDVLKLTHEKEAHKLFGLVGIDVSPASVEEMRRRVTKAGLLARLFVCDIGRFEWGTALCEQDAPKFDSVSIQFALHYFTTSPDDLRHMFQQLALVCEDHAVVFGTTMRAGVSYHPLPSPTARPTQPIHITPSHAPSFTPRLGQQISVFIQDLVQTTAGEPLMECVVDWPAMELILHECGFHVHALRPMPNDPTGCYMEFELSYRQSLATEFAKRHLL